MRRRRCPFGDDPKTTAPSLADAVVDQLSGGALLLRNGSAFASSGFEVQNVSCVLGPARGPAEAGAAEDGEGSFRLSFRGATTRALAANSTTLAELEAALEELQTIGDVRIELTSDASEAGEVRHIDWRLMGL